MHFSFAQCKPKLRVFQAFSLENIVGSQQCQLLALVQLGLSDGCSERTAKYVTARKEVYKRTK